MTTASPTFGTRQSITWTTTSLASDTNLLIGRESTVLDLETLDGIDVNIGGVIATGTSPTASRQIEIWAYELAGDTEYTGSATGSDAGLTVTAETKVNMKLVTIIPTNSTSDTSYRWASSIMRVFGYMPRKVGLWVTHNTGVNLKSTGHEAYYETVKYESA